MWSLRRYSVFSNSKSASSDRNQLDTEGSLSFIPAVKMELLESQEKCYCLKPRERLLNSAKKATCTYNKSKGQY